MATFKDLEIWKEGIDLVVKIYNITYKYPENEKFGLTQHIRKTSVSVPSNIAEGDAKSIKDNIRFLNISFGSCNEPETQLIVASRLKYCNIDLIINDLQKERKMISGYIKYLEIKLK